MPLLPLSRQDGKSMVSKQLFYLVSLLSLKIHVVIRIDNGGLQYMCTWFCDLSDIMAMHQSIWT